MGFLRRCTEGIRYRSYAKVFTGHIPQPLRPFCLWKACTCNPCYTHAGGREDRDASPYKHSPFYTYGNDPGSYRYGLVWYV